ncbi:hypothetical protein BB560_006129, partial [Smittium megazygosporum]
YIDLIPTPLLHADIILGIPWLRKHNPSIDFENTKIKFNSSYCNVHCFNGTKELCAVFKVPENCDDETTSDCNQNISKNNDKSNDINSEAYDTASEGEWGPDQIWNPKTNFSTTPHVDYDTYTTEIQQTANPLLPQNYSTEDRIVQLKNTRKFLET